MNRSYMKLATIKTEGGWKVIVTETNWLTGMGLRMCKSGYFFPVNIDSEYTKIYGSRDKAREDIKGYMKLFKYIRITGGLH